MRASASTTAESLLLLRTLTVLHILDRLERNLARLARECVSGELVHDTIAFCVSYDAHVLLEHDTGR